MSHHRLACALAAIALTTAATPVRAQDPPVGGFGPGEPARRPPVRPLPAQPAAPTAEPARRAAEPARRAAEPPRARPADPARAHPVRRAQPPAQPGPKRRAIAEGAGGSAEPSRRATTGPRADPVPEERVGTGPTTADPFAPPKGKAGPPKIDPKKPRPWFVRPAIEMVVRLSPDRSFLPQEGFGFSLEAGGAIGRGSYRLGLAIGYSYHRVARDLNLPTTAIDGLICEGVRDVTYHLATGSILGQLHFGKVAVWAGARGGFAYGKIGNVYNSGSSCGTDEAEQPTGVLGPVIGLGYALRPDLLLGLNASYLHFFSKKTYAYDNPDPDGDELTHPIFVDLVTIGLAITLTF